MDRDRFDKYDKGCCDSDFRHDNICNDHDDGWDLGSWLPIIIIVFLLCGGTNIFGGFGHKDDFCGDNTGFDGSWLLILILVFFLLGNQKDGKGFLGGLF
ncbi:MAG: hypothetical protein PHE79_02275 [Eubacteriales bacterium]|nr:hypothetical protein [Eubacteriales bacterium]